MESILKFQGGSTICEQVVTYQNTIYVASNELLEQKKESRTYTSSLPVTSQLKLKTRTYPFEEHSFTN